MSYALYKVLHVVAALVLFASLGTLAAAPARPAGALGRIAAAAHGLALAVILVAGFGILARLGLAASIPAWAWAKAGVWLLLGLAVVPLRRKPEWAPALWVVLPLFGGLAVWLAVMKPF
jgi:hypothetical protein